MSAPDPSHAYATRHAELVSISRALERRSATISTLRGVTFLIVVGVIVARLIRPLPPFAWGIGGVALAAFLALVVTHAYLVTKMAAVELRIRLVDQGLQRIAGDIAALPQRGERFSIPGNDGGSPGKLGSAPKPPDHSYLGDLDIFGSSSLFQLVSTAQTGAGERTLAAWLSAPASAPEIAARQEAARELAALPALREELAVDGAASRTRGIDAEPLLDWAEGRDLSPPTTPRASVSVKTDGPAKAQTSPPPRISRPLARLGQVMVVITLGLLVASEILGSESLGRLRHLWLVPFLLQIGILMALRPALEPILRVVASPEAPFGRYMPLLRRIEGQPFTAGRLAALRATLTGATGAEASRAFGALQRIVSFAEIRHSGMAHFLINTFLLWDLFCALALDRWRARFGGHARAWLNALAEVEALSSLGTFAFEHPEFAFPEVTVGEPRFEAEGLGHPLIPASRRVDNDVVIGRAGAALMITGSNMSGKSTLLRAMGVNAVLALAGAPVCARRLGMHVCWVRTSMRVKDSLEEGVSHFYAELKRLKAVVDAVNEGDQVLFLLDEVLHGTNSRERQIGAKAVVRHLLDRGAVGAVSSHDLGLADLERESDGRVTNVHFEELVKDGKMTFDYRLKPGVVTTANALRLMKLIGIAVELPEVE
jgi:hypothetical protein